MSISFRSSRFGRQQVLMLFLVFAIVVTFNFIIITSRFPEVSYSHRGRTSDTAVDVLFS